MSRNTFIANKSAGTEQNTKEWSTAKEMYGIIVWFLCIWNLISVAWMHVCVRFVCCGSMTQFSGHAGTSLALSLSFTLSLSLYPAENLSRLSSHRVLFCCYRNNHCAGLGMCFFKKWLPTRNLSLRYIILPWLYSYLLTLPCSNPVVWKRGSDLTSRTRCLSYQYEERVRE